MYVCMYVCMCMHINQYIIENRKTQIVGLKCGISRFHSILEGTGMSPEQFSWSATPIPEFLGDLKPPFRKKTTTTCIYQLNRFGMVWRIPGGSIKAEKMDTSQPVESPVSGKSIAAQCCTHQQNKPQCLNPQNHIQQLGYFPSTLQDDLPMNIYKSKRS